MLLLGGIVVGPSRLLLRAGSGRMLLLQLSRLAYLLLLLLLLLLLCQCLLHGLLLCHGHLVLHLVLLVLLLLNGGRHAACAVCLLFVKLVTVGIRTNPCICICCIRQAACCCIMYCCWAQLGIMYAPL